jgi:hypothetical protein
MINIKIDKPYKIKTDWKDVTFRKVLELADLVDTIPKPFKQRIFGEEKKDDITSEDAINFKRFQIQYVSKLNDIPTEVLENVQESNGVGIQYIFDMCSKFLGMPTENDVDLKDCIILDGEKLYPVQSAVDAMGRVSHFQDADMATFTIGMTLQSLIDRTKKGNFKISELTLLTASIFRPNTKTKGWFSKEIPEPYNYDKVKERSLKMEQLPADQIFAAYFFLQKQQHKYLIDIRNSSSEAITSIPNRLRLRVALQMIYIKWSIIGLFRAMRLRVTGYLPSRIKRQ